MLNIEQYSDCIGLYYYNTTRTKATSIQFKTQALFKPSKLHTNYTYKKINHPSLSTMEALDDLLNFSDDEEKTKLPFSSSSLISINGHKDDDPLSVPVSIIYPFVWIVQTRTELDLTRSSWEWVTESRVV